MSSVWRSPAYLGIFGDPYLRNTSYEAGGDPHALLETLTCFVDVLQQDPQQTDEDEPVPFPLTLAQAHVVQTCLIPQLQFCLEWTAKGVQVDDATQLQRFLTEWKSALGHLEVGQPPILVPGGYVGPATSHAMIYVLEKTRADPAEYSFTVCNKGPGADMYHPCRVDDRADKIRVQSCIQVGAIPAARFFDMAFWALLFSLWVRKVPSEYHRVETLYDVLLPWLAGDTLLPLALERTEKQTFADWKSAALGGAHTAQRSRLGFCKSAIEAMRYACLRSRAFTPDEVEYAILFKLRYRLFEQVVKELEVVENPAKAIPEDALDRALKILYSMSLQDALQGAHTVAEIDPDDAVVGIYFTLTTSSACAKLSNVLKTLSQNLYSATKKFVLVVVSLDQEQTTFTAFAESLPEHTWLLVPFSEREARKQLVEIFHVTKLPTLILRGGDGKILTPLGAEVVTSDPTGTFYPWTGEDFKLPKSVLSESDTKCIAMGVKQMCLKTLKHHDRKDIDARGLSHVRTMMSQTEQLLKAVGVNTSTSGSSKCETTLLKRNFNFACHAHTELLQLQRKESEYAGNAAEPETPLLSNFLVVPERVTSIPLAVAAFVRCRALCDSLLQRAAEGSSSSRLSLHYKVIQLLTSLLVEVLPMPEPIGTDGTMSPACIWTKPVAKDMQLRCLSHLHSILMIFGSVWQSIEQPSRPFDSERALAGLCALCIFDALLRTPASDDPLEISLMMEEEGGYVLAHTFCKANISIQHLTSSMELARPKFCVIRGQVLAYFHSLDVKGKQQLFDYHMPEDKIEVKRYSTTLLFVRQLLERYHYQLIDPKNETPPSEMEALMDWFCSDTTPMAKDHPEVSFTRNVVMVVKFLATMETKEVELMRRRTDHQHWQMWQLSFDDSVSTRRRNFIGIRGLNQILHATLKWEVVHFRGSDQEIADVEVEGFLGRKVYFGEGPIVTSPANLTLLLADASNGGLSGAITEEDIMHLTDLPTFNGTLSAEESEYLMSYLTVPYTMIPLVASFFASRDRLTYLFNPVLQQLFRAVLFQGGDWVSNEKVEHITHIPLRKSSLGIQEEILQRTFDARICHQKCEDHLGTMNGLLLNELLHAPEAIILPLLKMLNAVKELSEASVHSADARFILFMIKLSVDMLRYVTLALDQCVASDDQVHVQNKLENYRSQLFTYTFGFAKKILTKWRQEAEVANNLQTACVIHSYLVLIHIGLRCSEYDTQKISNMLGSIAYVHNWHCFGVKLSADNDGRSCNISAQERLLRWLQAQGIDTGNVDTKSLDKYLKGRPLFLKVGMQTIQAPNIVEVRAGNENEFLLPPGDVLEAEVFETIQVHRRSIVQWLANLSRASRNKVLGDIVRIALRSTEQTDDWDWIEESDVGGVGKFKCQQQELKLDVQTGEILWRNDELKPVPDSMTQFADFMAIFGNRSLHCGLVARQEHRTWINIVGTDYQLLEWDDPTDEIDQGVGAPVVCTSEVSPNSNDPSSDSQELKMYWECQACTCANFNGDNPSATCQVCDTPRLARAQQELSRKKEDPNAKASRANGFRYLGQIFSRPFDIYAEKEHPHVDEEWVVDLVGSILRFLYPPMPEDKKLPFVFFLPKNPLPATATRVHMIGLDRGSDENDKEKMATFKELVAYRTIQVVHIFALVSHGRRVYRKLIFTSNSRLSLHSFPLNVPLDQGSVDPALLQGSGDPTERQTPAGSLVILRKNPLLHGTEQFIPPRLLQGVVPSCLLENFRFWMGEDGRLRGNPVDSKSQWFRYRVEIELKEAGQAFIYRKSFLTSFSQSNRGKSDLKRPKGNIQSHSYPVLAPEKQTTESVRPPLHPEPDISAIRDDDVVQLMALGFSYAACSLALRENRNDVDLAAQWLLGEDNQAAVRAAEEAAASAAFILSPEEQHENNIGLLMSLDGSPSRVVAEHALNLFDNDVELAKAWLSDSASLAEIERVDAAQKSCLVQCETSDEELPQPMEASDSERKLGVSEDVDMLDVNQPVDQSLYLLNMLADGSTCENGEIQALAELVCRVENLSHVLVWCTSEEAVNASCSVASIAYVELPRLKLKLLPKLDQVSGRVRLEVMDQNGWFVSDLTLAMPERTSKYLRLLVEAAPDCFVLESDTTDVKLLCPNHDLYRPSVRGEPLSTTLVSDRESMGWQQAMETRFFTYPVHSSYTFLLPSSLSSTLYLILSSLLKRNYLTAVEFIVVCNVDVKFTDEEKRIFDQLAKTLDDRHPNACACRIRLSLCIVYSDNKTPWKLNEELYDYLTTSKHVDASCRLNVEEEKEALMRCQQHSPLLLLRKEFCDHVQPQSVTKMDFKLTQSHIGGQPWSKLCLYSKEYLAAFGKKLSTVRYNRPKHNVGIDKKFLIDEEEAGKLAWNCAVVGDEISGMNRGLGFLFLYECLNQQLVVRLGGVDCARSFGDLYTRFLHLKMSKWGREIVDDGEDECTPSTAIAHLAMMTAHPADEWPSSPCDQESVNFFTRGTSLYSEKTAGTALKDFFDILEMEFQAKLESQQHVSGVINPIKAQFSQLRYTTEQVVQISISPSNCLTTFNVPNASCSERQFVVTKDCPLNPEFPLEAIDVKQFVTFADPEAQFEATLPFDLSKHPMAQTAAAKDMLKRLDKDIATNAHVLNESKNAFVKGVTPATLLSLDEPERNALAIANLLKLIHMCENMRTCDRRLVEKEITTLEVEANEIREDISENSGLMVAANRFVLERHSGLYPWVTFDFLTSLLTSESLEADLKARNPFVVNVTEECVAKILLVLFLCSRIVHLNRTIGSAHALVQLLTSLLASQRNAEWSTKVKMIRQASRDLADILKLKRPSLRSFAAESSFGWSFDPRFVVFEYVFDILLRDRQVQMVNNFLTSFAKGNSRVQQMIMGAGKTTVVGPLLTYILADKTHLVTHVMPTALLEQSRQVLRNRFSNRILNKRIFTFEFDRAITDDPDIALQLFTKLDRARRHGDVVCASPESIKSMILKFIELLHSLDESCDVIQLPFASASQNTRRLKRTLENRSEMADELQKTLRLWQKSVLVMDEVDVLLHPLRSELNFPIGNKFPIDLAANRWELPIYLIDCVLAAPNSIMALADTTLSSLILRLHTVLDEGFSTHSLQRFPHLVLLDMDVYETRMLPLLSEIAIEWLLQLFCLGKCDVSVDRIKYFLECPHSELHANPSLRADLENGLSESSMKLLNLARDWLRTILPHVLSKINRVSYGLLRGEYQKAATQGFSGGNTQSRLLLAVPFIGKDVPSHSSEFAHPDVLIGLTILAYRYEGIRTSDLVRIVSQLKQDFSRQLGPRDQRPSCVMFREWVHTGLCALSSEAQETCGGVLPLPLFQLHDSTQLARLHFLLAKLAAVVYYYVRQHVFPSCMNFQKLKLSACGHELGSNALFAKRIGFSGTPSNLLPIDLGECHYEPCSDGSIFQALTNPSIVSIERKVAWTARSLLLDIALTQPPVHALIDTGALITGFDNQEVAAFLLAELSPDMEGVVYLDANDRQMILLRDHNAAMPLIQCGLHPSKRFTFYDQVHTTGMDIKQCVNARAVLTLGKDMTFRDYAQGAYRMRGIATGQSLYVYLIPEVENRIRHEMKLAQVEFVSKDSANDGLRDFLLLVPAWLLTNSMRMESMQLVQLSFQELHNTWRRQALYSLLDEIDAARSAGASLNSRLHRFLGHKDDAAKTWLRKCIALFRTEISYAVDAVVPTRKRLMDVIQDLIESHKDFLPTDAYITSVKQRLTQVTRDQEHLLAVDGSKQGDLRLTAEVVHENEAQAEEEAEEEAEQEEQKMSAFTRDDEHPIPWRASLLAQPPEVAANACTGSQTSEMMIRQQQDDSADVFYPLFQFQVHTECPTIDFPANLLVSGNFFRRRWVGLGERRVKNVGLILEWVPFLHQEGMKSAVQHLFVAFTAAGTSGASANEIAIQALQAAAEMASMNPDNVSPAVKEAVTIGTSRLPAYLVTLSLAEGETIRRMIHTKHPIFQISQVQLRTIEGELVESSSFLSSWLPKPLPVSLHPREKTIAVGLQCLRFFNNEMYYFPHEIQVLLDGLANVPISLRHEFFQCLLRLRRRERHLWEDTPLAKVFTAQSEWHLLTARARLQQFQQSLVRKQRQYQKKKEKENDPKQPLAALHLAVALRQFDGDDDGRLRPEEVYKCFESYRLGFSSKELNEIIGVIVDSDENERPERGILIETICAAFGISRKEMETALRLDEEKNARGTVGLRADVSWGCPVCTYLNDSAAAVCGACHEPHPNHEASSSTRQRQQGWRCNTCTFINQSEDATCAICEMDMHGERGVPRGKWVCAGEQGGCTFFNAMSSYYCDVCNRARPDLANKRF